MILSLLLDTVVGTQKIIEIRQDYCKTLESLLSTCLQANYYFTGSKSEGLDLPGSDEDYMYDVNQLMRIKVTQSLYDSPGIFPYTTFFMSTENVPPGFALLHVIHQTLMNPVLNQSSKYMYGMQYLSSDLFMHYKELKNRNYISMGQIIKRQGPSTELWLPFSNKSESGIDIVGSIHCAFWPKEASEWVQRQRHFDWPTSKDICSVTNFGFHLVAVGHPHSDTKLMEWRISFSWAERILVWSFNHVQMQCYAVMKIILKEFIKVKCSPQNQVLCSYFIKTFLFWKYESSELNFWRADNFRECIMYLLSEFSKCVREGVLRHYFIPKFNLLSVKLTPAAQHELLQLFDIIIQSDISILKECRTLRDIWSEFIAQVPESRNNLISNLKRKKLLMNDECMARMVKILSEVISWQQREKPFKNVIKQISALSCKTHLKTLTIRRWQLEMQSSLLIQTCAPGNKGMYRLHRTAQNDIYSYDISNCKLLCSILLYMKGSTLPALDMVNQVLSSIPPYAMYYSEKNLASNEAKRLYVDAFQDADVSMTQRLKKAWLFDLLLLLTPDLTDVMPFAIQIELYFSYSSLQLSPFTFAYYLQFLCYHRMQQYDNRNRALRQLIEVAFNREQCGNFVQNSLNIAGHCLLLAGRRAQARDMFIVSYLVTQMRPPHDEYNSALWYLLNCF